MLNPDIRGQEEFSKEEMSKLTLEEWVSAKEANQSWGERKTSASPIRHNLMSLNQRLIIKRVTECSRNKKFNMALGFRGLLD